MKNLLTITTLLLMMACQDDFAEPIPQADFLYSGTIQLMEKGEIRIDGEAYPNDLNSGPFLVVIAENKETDQIQFTIYAKRYNIYEADFWVNDASCMEFNNIERVFLEKDKQGNDIIQIFYPDGFWKDCYYENEKEKALAFLIKSRNTFF